MATSLESWQQWLEQWIVPIAGHLYGPLQFDDLSDPIRLLEIQPCENTSAAIECTLRTARLSDNPEYVALSYVWGDFTAHKTAYINGVNVELTEQLDLALRRLRDGTSERVVWADAICINQSDLVERNSQVSIMGRIFKQANKVYSYIGPAEDGSDKALASLDTSNLDKFRPWDTRRGTSMFSSFIHNSITDHCGAAIHDVARNSYWRRAWIIQEIAFAKEIVVLYGSEQLPWQLFESLVFLSSTMMFMEGETSTGKGMLLMEFGDAIMEIMKIWQKYREQDNREQMDMLILLSQNRGTDATDPRDKIFAFYGLAHSSHLFITVDYSIPTAETYELFARKHIIETASLDVILHATRTSSPAENQLELPSWVPDWSNKEGRSSRPTAPFYSAAGNEKANAVFDRTGKKLLVKGVLCDKIHMFVVGNTPSGYEDLLFYRGPYDYPTRTSRLQALFRVTVADRYAFSNYRLNDDPELFLHRLIIGFLTDLGIYARLDVHAYNQHSGLPSEDSINPRAEIDDLSKEGQGSLPHMFVHRFGDWATACVYLLQGMITRKRLPRPDQYGGIQDQLLFDKVVDLEKSSEQWEEATSPELDYLLAWKSSLEKIPDCSSLQDALELISGPPGGPTTITWPEETPIGHEPFYVPRYRLSKASGTGSKVLFVTNDGYIGSGSPEMRSGDCVFVLRGCHMPVILRPQGSQYVFLSECYVEGLMDGQALDWVKEGKGEEQDIEII